MNNNSKTKKTVDASKYALVDLHLHLDGSLKADDMLQMARMEGVEIPTDREVLKHMLICPEVCQSLNEYLECFKLPLSVMQTRNTIIYSMESLVLRLDKEGLIYAEIRYAPQQHTVKGLTQDDVVEASIEGLNRGISKCKNGFTANIILSCLRGGDNEANMETVRMARKYLGQGVVAIDLAGAEALYPTANYRELFAYARLLDVPFTLHAGEAAGVESIHLAIDYGARRIDHGIRSYNDAATRERIKRMDICLAFTPTSNLQTKAIPGVVHIKDYPIRVFLDDQVPCCINTDNITVSNTTLKHEFQKLFDAGLLTPEDAETIVISAIRHTFISPKEQEKLIEKAKVRMGI